MQSAQSEFYVYYTKSSLTEKLSSVLRHELDGILDKKLTQGRLRRAHELSEESPRDANRIELQL